MNDERSRAPWIDRAVAWWSPARGLRRAKARFVLDQIRGYEGASRGPRTQNWRTPPASANMELWPALPTLRDRSRDHARNNPWGKRAIGRLTTELVGFGVAASFSGKNSRNVAKVADAWKAWAGQLQCDVRGRHDFGGVQHLAVRAFLQSGEVLIRRVWDPAAPLGLRLQVLEADYLWSLYPYTGVMEMPVPGARVLNGVEINKYQEPVAYHLLPRHPGDVMAMVGSPQTVRVPASEIVHLFLEDRPEQGRGTPLLTTVLIRLRDLDEYADAQLTRQKIAACFAAFYTEPEGQPPAQPPVLCEQVEPGMIERLPAGMEVTFGSPPGVQGYDEFMTRELQGVGAGTGVPYEDLTGDYSKVNFSSARMGRAAFHALVDEIQWLLLVPRFLNRVWSWWQDAARIAGVPVDGVEVQWTMPRKTLVDPAREIPAAIRGVRAGFSSPQEAMRELGYDPKQIIEEWKEFTELVDSLGLVFDIDPRKTTLQGAAAAPAGAADGAAPGDGKGGDGQDGTAGDGEEPVPAPQGADALEGFPHRNGHPV
jgi:lambda family phage portal protein